MKVGDMIEIMTGNIREKGNIGLLIRIGKWKDGRPVATVMIDGCLETWPLDSHYKFEVISESR